MAQQRKIGLGRGLSALLKEDDIQASKPQEQGEQVGETALPVQAGSINFVDVSLIAVNPFQPRTEFDSEALSELSESIKLQGLIQPITVRQVSKDEYQLISGERRLRATKLAGLTSIPAYVRTANDQQMLEMALIENIQRENLNAIEIALSFQRMIEECELKQEELGNRVSKSRSTVTNYLRLLKLPPSIQAAIRDGQITMGHARALINIADVEKQLFVFQEILSKALSVRKTEELVRIIQGQTPDDKKVKKKERTLSFQMQRVEDDLASKFSAPVKVNISNKKGQGAIQIPFESDEDLSRILELLDW